MWSFKILTKVSAFRLNFTPVFNNVLRKTAFTLRLSTMKCETVKQINEETSSLGSQGCEYNQYVSQNSCGH